MRFFFLFVVFLMCTVRVSAQSPDALRKALERADTDSLQITALQDLANYYRYSNTDSAKFFASQGLTYARETGYRYGEAVMLNSLGQVNERHGNLDHAKNYYLQALAIFNELGNKKAIAGTTNGLGVIAGRTGKYDEATKYFLEALAMFEEIGNKQGIIQSHIKLGVVSDHLGNLDEALTYYLKAEKLNGDDSSSSAFLTLMNNIGIIYGKRNDLATAIMYFRRGLRASDPLKDTGIHIALLGSLGLAYEKSGVEDSAWFYQQQALSMARQSNLPEEEARALVNLAALVVKTDPSQSLALLNEALAISERIQQLKLKTEIYEAMIVLYKERNDYQLALAVSEKRQLLKDSLFSLEKSREIANLHAMQEIARQENEIRSLALQNEKSIFQRNLMIAVALGAIAMIGIVWFYNTRISTLNTQLLAKQTELKNSNTLKDKLFSILGHDLRAPLNRVIGLLNMLAVKRPDDEETPIIEKLRLQSQNTLETLDNLLLWGQTQLKGIRLNPQEIKVKEQVSKSILLSADYATQKNVQLQDNVPANLQIHADPSHFDFVVRNLLSNAIKFSHSGGTVSIGAVPFADREVIFSIRDNGVGIHPDLQNKIFTSGTESLQGTWNEKGTGIGLMLCREYIAENGGRLWLESKEGKGSTFFFSLKKNTISNKQDLNV
jgi:signal transduction histidine kinase/Flp pilus assembly protein TadD